MSAASDGRVASASEPATAPVAVTSDGWTDWRTATPARLALGRAGAGMPTDETLRFGLAHALARDAVHAALDVEALADALRADGWRTEHVASRAPDRTAYLRRPDLGRQVDPADLARLRTTAAAAGRDRAGSAAPRGTALRQAQGERDSGECDLAPTPVRAEPVEAPSPADATSFDLAIVIGDGLSSFAAARHAVPLLAALRRHLPASIRYPPVTIATQARVALADDVGEAYGARLALMLIGERPGLSSPDSLGLYLTHAPRRGRHDAERNCISNVRPEGLPYEAAAFKLAWLIRAASSAGQTGIGLKDESDLAVLEAAGASAPRLV